MDAHDVLGCKYNPGFWQVLMARKPKQLILIASCSLVEFQLPQEGQRWP